MADINHLCPGCMREIKQNTTGNGVSGAKGGTCPYCGFRANTYQQNSRCLPVNTILAGKYLVGKVLGQGGFGITYIGFDLNMETRVAIKEYFPVELASRDTTSMTGDRVLSLSGDKQAVYQQGLKKYVAEAQNISQFSGTPGVVSVKDFFYENETAYIVMEYIDGESLKDYLKEKGGILTEEEALFIMKPVLEALEKVHASGIIHRDISPDNIMLTFEGSGTEHDRGSSTATRKIASIKLIDFGAARMTAKNDQKSLTIILKHGYAPEEQYRTHGEQGTWTDVYAVCAVLYRMLTGETPVPAMDRMFQDNLKGFDQFQIKVSKNTVAAIIKGLAIKKENRILTMQELIQVLYEGKAVRGGAASGVKNSKTGSKKTGIIAAGAAALLIAGAAAVLFGSGDKTADDQLTTAQSTAILEASTKEVNSTLEPEENPDTEVVNLGNPDTDELGETIAFASPQTSISAWQEAHTLMVMPDGTVKAWGGNKYGQCMVQDWNHIVAVSSSHTHSLGLRSDGKVFAAGENTRGKCEVQNWTDIVAIAAGRNASYGLRTDGTVVACGNNYDGHLEEVAEWKDIIAITSLEASNGVIGLDRSGRVHYAGVTIPTVEINDWQDVRYLTTGRMHGTNLIGICEDGRIKRAELEEVTTMDEVNTNYFGLEEWNDIKQLSAQTPALGVKSDGTVAFLDNCDEGLKAELAAWTDMRAITSAYIWDRLYVIGLKQDGTILEYWGNHGNSTPEEMKNLEWVQVMNVFGDNLIARTKDGQILTYGLERGRLNMLTMWKQRESAEVAGIIGDDAVIFQDKRVYSNHNSGNKRTGWIGTNVKQAVELIHESFGNFGYALLKEDGHVEIKIEEGMFTGNWELPEETRNQLKIAEQWSDVIQIASLKNNLFALHSDGTISMVGKAWWEEPMDATEGIKKLACRDSMMVGIRDDDTADIILSSEYDEIFGRTQLYGWKDIADVSVGESHVVGLKKDGTVIAAGSNHAGQCEVEDWKDIAYLTTGRNVTLGITKDGDLKMAGSLY